jgi:hypothetical protein
MSRDLSETLADLDRMEVALARLSEVMYARPYFQSLYEEAFARVRSDLGPCVRTIYLLNPAAEPKEIIEGIRAFISDTDQRSDVPQTSPPGGCW